MTRPSLTSILDDRGAEARALLEKYGEASGTCEHEWRWFGAGTHPRADGADVRLCSKCGEESDG